MIYTVEDAMRLKVKKKYREELVNLINKFDGDPLQEILWSRWVELYLKKAVKTDLSFFRSPPVRLSEYVPWEDDW